MIPIQRVQTPPSLPPVPFASLNGPTPYAAVTYTVQLLDSAAANRRHNPYRLAALRPNGPPSVPTVAAAASSVPHTDRAFFAHPSGLGWRRDPYARMRSVQVINRAPFSTYVHANFAFGSEGYMYSHGPVHPPFPDPAAPSGTAAAMVAAAPMVEIAVGNLPYGICAREVQCIIREASGVSVHAVRFWLHRGNRQSGLAFVEVRATDRAAVIGLHERILVGADVFYIYDSTQDAQRHLNNRDRLHPSSSAPKQVTFV